MAQPCDLNTVEAGKSRSSRPASATYSWSWDASLSYIRPSQNSKKRMSLESPVTSTNYFPMTTAQSNRE